MIYSWLLPKNLGSAVESQGDEEVECTLSYTINYCARFVGDLIFHICNPNPNPNPKLVENPRRPRAGSSLFASPFRSRAYCIAVGVCFATVTGISSSRSWG